MQAHEHGENKKTLNQKLPVVPSLIQYDSASTVLPGMVGP